MAHSARRPFIALAFFLVLSLPAMARASVIYDFVTTAYTGTIPHFEALTDIRLTLGDSGGVEQFSWWTGDRLPIDDATADFIASVVVQPDSSLTGNILFGGPEDTLFLTYDALDGIWRGSAFSDRPPVCSGETRTCTFEGYFAQVPEPGTLSILAGTLLVLGFAARRANARQSVLRRREKRFGA